MSQFIEMFGNPLSSKQKNELKRLGQCCIINPRRPNIALCDTDKVSFIPMPAVSEDGYLVDMADEEYGKVKKGFTYFENNDVLFAKITPCMENGKGAIAYGLTNGIGVGSTEFHVLRPINGISSPYWLLTLTRMPIFRERAAKNMSGTGGQKRVSASYLNHFMVGLPAIEEQRRFEAIYKQADKSKFGDFKSQFIEMFGDTHMRSDHSRQWKEVVEIINGKDYKSIQVEDGGYPVYGTGGEMARASDYLSPANSILLGRKGTIDKPLLIREKYWNVDTAFGAVPDEKVLHYVYFYWHCKTIDFNVLNKGTTLPSTTKVDLLNLWIKIPSMEEQTRFGSIVEQADKSKSVIQKALVYLNDIQSDELKEIA